MNLVDTSWYEEEMLIEFTRVAKTYPKVEEMLNHCHVKIVQSFWGRDQVHFLPYLSIYYPQRLAPTVRAQKEVIKKLAQHVGLVEVACLNANRLIRDPKSKLKEAYPYLWQEINWIATQG